MVKANLKKLYNKKYHFLSFVKIVKESRPCQQCRLNMLLLLGWFELWTQYPGSVVPLAMFFTHFQVGVISYDCPISQGFNCLWYWGRAGPLLEFGDNARMTENSTTSSSLNISFRELNIFLFKTFNNKDHCFGASVLSRIGYLNADLRYENAVWCGMNSTLLLHHRNF